MNQNPDNQSNKKLREFKDRLHKAPELEFKDESGPIGVPLSIRERTGKSVRNIMQSETYLTPEEISHKKLLKKIDTLRTLLEKITDSTQKLVIESQIKNEENKISESKKAAETARRQNKTKSAMGKKRQVKKALIGITTGEISKRNASYDLLDTLNPEIKTSVFNLITKELLDMENVKKDIVKLLLDPANAKTRPEKPNQLIQRTISTIKNKKLEKFTADITSSGDLGTETIKQLTADYKITLDKEDVPEDEIEKNITLSAEIIDQLTPFIIELAEEKRELNFSTDMPALLAIAYEFNSKAKLPFGEDKVPSLKDYLTQLQDEDKTHKYPKEFQEIDKQIRENLKHFSTITNKITEPMIKVEAAIMEIPETILDILETRANDPEVEGNLKKLENDIRDMRLDIEGTANFQNEQNRIDTVNQTFGKLIKVPMDKELTMDNLDGWGEMIQQIGSIVDNQIKNSDQLTDTSRKTQQRKTEISRETGTAYAKVFGDQDIYTQVFDTILRRLSEQEGKPQSTIPQPGFWGANNFFEKALEITGTEDFERTQLGYRSPHSISRKPSDMVEEKKLNAKEKIASLRSNIQRPFRDIFSNLDSNLPENSKALEVYKRFQALRTTTSSTEVSTLNINKSLDDLKKLLKDCYEKFNNISRKINTQLSEDVPRERDLLFKIRDIARAHKIRVNDDLILSDDPKVNPLIKLWSGAIFGGKRNKEEKAKLDEYLAIQEKRKPLNELSAKIRNLYDAVNPIMEKISEKTRRY
ncbi:MAG: hypothetical protein WC269_00825 [Candidatus Gracilibacteria bacterium]|jgi:hypothetical protein